MTRRGAVVLLLSCLLLPVPLRAQSAADSLRALDSAWARTYAIHDTSLALRLFADDLVVTSANGALKTRAEETADIRPMAGLHMHFFRTTATDVGIYGNAAAVTGMAEWRFTFNRQTSDVQRAYTAIYQRGGPLGWRMVVLHLRRAETAAAAAGTHSGHRHPAGANILMRGTITGSTPGVQSVLIAADSSVYLLSPAPRSGVGPELKKLLGQPVRLLGTVYPAGSAYLILVDSARAATP